MTCVTRSSPKLQESLLALNDDEGSASADATAPDLFVYGKGGTECMISNLKAIGIGSANVSPQRGPDGRGVSAP
ncbi:hypothetical protein HDU96_007401 [Phlyctochytrium bullatum]|nr:hypothetical protein HDU96_007401 [Phlyctochytrium bullatum]